MVVVPTRSTQWRHLPFFCLCTSSAQLFGSAECSRLTCACAQRSARSNRRSAYGCGGRSFRNFFPGCGARGFFCPPAALWCSSLTFGGFAGAPLYINLMQALAWAMIALFVWLFHGPWLAFKRAVDAQDWPAAAVRINRIRQIIMINLPLGLIVIAIGSTGRFWG